MSSKFKVLSIALVVLMAFAFYSATTKADVTGSFGLSLSLNAIPCQYVALYNTQTQVNQLADQPCESTVFKIDFESNLNVNIAISGLTMGIHAHAGVTGIEDVILSFAATLGALDIYDEFVFAQPFGLWIAPDGQLIPVCFEAEAGSGQCDLLFVKKRVSATISLGGVTFSNLALIEDTAFPEMNVNLGGVIKTAGDTYSAADQVFGFGDIVTITGQTPSGITVIGETGICAKKYPYALNMIKKHYWLEEVNPDCTGTAETKPPLYFDYESLNITGIPLATGVTGSANVYCVAPGLDCTTTLSVAFEGGPIPFETSFHFTDLFTFDFDGATITLSQGFGTLTLEVTGKGEIGVATVALNFTLNPDTNPASLAVTADIVPGIGLDTVTVEFGVSRAGLNFGFVADYSGGEFQDVSFSLGAEAGVISASASATFARYGFDGANLSATVSF